MMTLSGCYIPPSGEEDRYAYGSSTKKEKPIHPVNKFLARPFPRVEHYTTKTGIRYKIYNRFAFEFRDQQEKYKLKKKPLDETISMI